MKSIVYLLALCVAAVRLSQAEMPSDAARATDSTVDGSAGSFEECSKCHGSDLVKCGASKCKEGSLDCPGKCLKLSVGKWEHMDVPGHGPDELWQKFAGRRGSSAWTTAHVGEVIEIHKGRPENMGKCRTCEGKTTVPCKLCQGSGTIACPMCHGNKVVARRTVPPARVPSPATPQMAATPPSMPPRNPSVRAMSKPIRLVDGSTFVGVITVSDADVSWIRTHDGKTIEVPTKKILPESTAEKP